jgi:hypothetical protein
MLVPTRRAVLLFVLAVSTGLLAGCDLLGVTSDSIDEVEVDPIDEVEFRVVQQEGGKAGSLTFSPGDSLTLSLNNTTNVEIGFNLSCSTLQKRATAVDDLEWMDVETDRPCDQYLGQLRPGRKHTKVITLPPDEHVVDGDLKAGEYRYVTDVRDEMGEEDRVEEVATQPFEVVRE